MQSEQDWLIIWIENVIKQEQIVLPSSSVLQVVKKWVEKYTRKKQ